MREAHLGEVSLVASPSVPGTKVLALRSDRLGVDVQEVDELFEKHLPSARADRELFERFVFGRAWRP